MPRFLKYLFYCILFPKKKISIGNKRTKVQNLTNLFEIKNHLINS